MTVCFAETLRTKYLCRQLISLTERFDSEIRLCRNICARSLLYVDDKVIFQGTEASYKGQYLH